MRDIIRKRVFRLKKQTTLLELDEYCYFADDGTFEIGTENCTNMFSERDFGWRCTRCNYEFENDDAVKTRVLRTVGLKS